MKIDYICRFENAKISKNIFMESINIKELNDRIQRESSFVDILTMEMNKVIVGQKHLVENLLIGLLAKGLLALEVDKVYRHTGSKDNYNANRDADDKDDFFLHFFLSSLG